MNEPERRTKRLRRFDENTKALNEETKRRGLTEEQMMADLEKTREEVYQRYYGDNQSTEVSGEESSS